MKIPTNEAHLRENLHEAVESLSLVNIIILLVLIRAVQVISWLRPSERDIKALPDPLAVPALPEPTFGSLPENYPGVASITAGAGPNLEDSELTVETPDGREHTFQDWHLAQERSLRSMEQRGSRFQPLHWEHIGVDNGIGQSRHRNHATVTPSGEPAYRTAILAWALNDVGDQLVLIRRPSGEFRIERDHRQNVKGDNTMIMAPQYPLEMLEIECDRANHSVGQYSRENSRYGLYANPCGYCTPCRDGMLTGAFDMPNISYGGPRNRATAEAYERHYERCGSLMNGDLRDATDGTGPHIRAHKHNPDS